MFVITDLSVLLLLTYSWPKCLYFQLRSNAGSSKVGHTMNIYLGVQSLVWEVHGHLGGLQQQSFEDFLIMLF